MVSAGMVLGTWLGAGCQYRRRALGLRRGVAAVGDELESTGSSSWCCSCRCGDVFAGDVVLLLEVGPGSSIVDNVFGVLSFFLFPFGSSDHYFEWPPYEWKGSTVSL